MSGQFSSSIAIEFVSNMYLKSNFADVHFEFSNDGQAEKVPAHKAILATASPVFRQMLFGPLKEGDVIKLPDTTVGAFKEFLQFFYLDKIALTMENIGEVARLCDFYDVSDCFEKCVEFLECQLSSENIVWGYQLAVMFNNQKLKNFCEKHIPLLIDLVLKSDEFLQCDQKLLQHILNIDSLNCKEADLFEACIAWAKASCQKKELDDNDSNNLREQLGDCFHLIRFGAMEDEEIDKILSNEVFVGLFTRDDLVDIMRLKWDKTFKSQAFNRTLRSETSIPWNSGNVLYCDLKNADVQLPYRIQSTESTWFSSNKPLVLGSIVLSSLTNDSGYNLPCEMHIIEYDSSALDTNASGNILFMKRFAQGSRYSRTVVLDSPIITKSGKAYEIQIQIKLKHSYYHYCVWKSEVNLGDNIVVKLRGEDSSDSNSKRRGVIEGMNFNRI